MNVEKPEKPQGQHVRILRLHLNLNQTELASLLGVAQAKISLLENLERDKELEPLVAARLMLLWDLFPTRPSGGVSEMMARLFAYEQAQSGTPGNAGGSNEPESGEVPRSLPHSLLALITAATKLAVTLNKAASLWLARESLSARKKNNGEPQGRRSPLYRHRFFRRPAVGFQGAVARRGDVLAGFIMLSLLIVGTPFVSRIGGRLARQFGLLGADEVLTADMGARQEGLPMPHEPLPGQVTGKCRPGYTSLFGACWLKVADQYPPCLPGFYSYENACSSPVFLNSKPNEPIGGERAK